MKKLLALLLAAAMLLTFAACASKPAETQTPAETTTEETAAPAAETETKEEAAANALRLLRRIGLADKRDEYPSKLSGGQRQRLCIARAIIADPKVIIFDDSTSAVDTKTDAQIRKALREYIPETTKIIIAQRIASVQDADLILVMDGGAIAASGTHEELLKTSEIYREVYESQTNGGDENA